MQCARSATTWASSRTGDPYFVILGGIITCHKSLCFLCPNPYPFPTRVSENTRVYAPGFGTSTAKMLRINPDPKKNARDIFFGRSGYRLGFIWGPLGISLGIYPVAAREIAWDFSGGRSGYRLGFIRGPLGILLGIFANVPYPIGRRFQKSQVRPNPLNTPPDAFPTVPNPPSFLCLTDLLLHNPHP